MSIVAAVRPAVPASCQVSTPRAIADLMVSVLEPASTDAWLEPCVGSGALLRALSRAGVGRAQVRGVDLDPTPLGFDSLGMVLRGVDFLGWSLTTSERFSAIVANPPYMPLARSHPDVLAASRRIIGPASTGVGRGANTWYAFLCASLSLLADRGRLAFLLPASWEYADYAHKLRVRLSSLFRVVDVHRAEKPLFDTVKEGSVLLICKDFGVGRGAYRRTLHQGAAGLVRALAPGQPTRRERRNAVAASTQPLTSIEAVPFESVFRIAIGGVVGDARFFLLNEARRVELGLPTGSLRPVVSRAKHLSTPLITPKVWETLRRNNERIWLFSPPAGLRAHPRVREYLRLSPSDGGCIRSAGKVAGRPQWSRPVMPTRVEGFLSGMSSAGPWIAFSRMPRLSASNTLYVVRTRSVAVRANRYVWALGLLTSSVREQIRMRTRRYADGLCKLEPCDINALMLPVPRSVMGARRAYVTALGALLAGDDKLAAGLADTWFGS